MGQQFAPEEFMKALQDQQLPPQQEEPPVFPETISGLTRTPEHPTPGVIPFSPDECISWFNFPLILVEKVEYLGMRPCWNYGPSAGHEHPAVILHLKPPEPANEAATAYYKVLQAVLATRRR
jgi:hypothetical protein